MINRELLKADSKGLLKLPTDKVLVEDPEFRKYVILYAKVHQLKCFTFTLKSIGRLIFDLLIVHNSGNGAGRRSILQRLCCLTQKTLGAGIYSTISFEISLTKDTDGICCCNNSGDS